MRNNVRMRRERRLSKIDVSLNLIPYMDLMVVLIPFLLTGVVFSKLAILDLKLPVSSAAAPAAAEAKEPFRLIVTLQQDAVTVRGSGLSVIRVPLQNGQYDLGGLATTLQQVKASYPQEKSLILLSEPDIPYEFLVAVMDVCREGPSSQELFPDISIGEVKRA
ncbi:MAG: biopolymer transporter ExbD [Nitrospirae bacterium]|nr:biopolymer transporter ExbD [Nitrospirota bacterium]